MTKSGFRLGSTSEANCEGDNICEIAKTLGRIYGSRCVSFISSRREGSIFLILNPSENLSRTPVSPFMKDIFSSRDLAVKFDRSRKFRVEMGSDEKKECAGNVVGDGLLCGCRDISDVSSPVGQIENTTAATSDSESANLSNQDPIVPCWEAPCLHSRECSLDYHDSSKEACLCNVQHTSNSRANTCLKLDPELRPVRIPGLEWWIRGDSGSYNDMLIHTDVVKGPLRVSWHSAVISGEFPPRRCTVRLRERDSQSQP